MRKFEILFDQAEPSKIEHPAYAHYGSLGFPPAHPHRPWIFANFVQSIDGIASFKGKHAAGGDISRSSEDGWLMQLLRAHAGALIMGVGTLLEETRTMPQLNNGRGSLYRVEASVLRELRQRLGLGREKIIFVTASAWIDPSLFRVFDGDLVDAFILTGQQGAERLAGKHPNVLVAADDSGGVDLEKGMRLIRSQLDVQHLLCEGGPTLYGNMSRRGLIDEKFLTISPVEIGLLIPPEQERAPSEMSHPPTQRPTTFTAPGFTAENAPWWRWMSCRRVEEHEFNRYRRTS
ncbi:MAG TPA: dihydrofolate reductase family protein [Candidatus Angelobacter sp.]|jgi:riboflavin biosynthesis pyrimidine reductase|nr:dihydrofolate reductase family protein [Candidatus Angelobacter sp.]